MRYFFFIFIIVLLFGGCKKDPPAYSSMTGETMGTTYLIKYAGSENYQSDVDSLLELLNNSMSTYIQASLISKINDSPADVSFVIDAHFEKVFSESVRISKITNGAFDPSIMPVLNYWGFGGSKRKVSEVDSAVIDSLKMLIGLDKFQLENAKNGTLISKKTNSMLDFSAVAKGYAVDVLSEFLMNKQVNNFMVEIGGEVRSLGVNDRGEVWIIGIDKPVESTEERKIQDIFRLKNMAMATSGNYRNYKVINGEKVGHTFNPKTGYPEESDLLSASVFSKECLTADAFATACMVMGLNKSIELVESLDELEAYFVYIDEESNLQTISTDGAKLFQIEE